eukprot:10904623-Alexandrium_andersonii.AAC.1
MSAEEGRVLRAARDPAQPADEERRRRACTCLPFRYWRAHCAGGRVPNAALRCPPWGSFCL